MQMPSMPVVLHVEDKAMFRNSCNRFIRQVGLPGGRLIVIALDYVGIRNLQEWNDSSCT